MESNNRIVSYERLIKRRVAVVTLSSLLITAAAYIAITDMLKGEARTADAWHREHGNAMKFGDHQIILPENWYEESHTESRAVAARVTTGPLKGQHDLLIMERKSNGEAMLTDSQLRAWMEKRASLQRKYGVGFKSSSTLEIDGKAKMYCVRTVLMEDNIEIRCNVVDEPIAVTWLGAPKREAEGRAIVSSYE